MSADEISSQSVPDEVEVVDQQSTVEPSEPAEEEAPVDLAKIEEERRNEIEREIEALPEGPEKTMRTYGLPSTVYKIFEDNVIEISLAKVIAEAKEIGVYFSASWCNPCQEFSPKLKEAYTKINSEKYSEENKDRKPQDVQAFEIILLPVDREKSAHDAYFGTMPWWSVDYDGVAYFRMKLCEAFQLESIPTFIIFDTETGTPNTTEGYDAVERYGESLENYPWNGYTKPFTVRAMNFLMSKLPLLAIMGFMLFRNYTSTQQMQSVAKELTTTTTTTFDIMKHVVLNEIPQAAIDAAKARAEEL